MYSLLSQKCALTFNRLNGSLSFLKGCPWIIVLTLA